MNDIAVALRPLDMGQVARGVEDSPGTSAIRSKNGRAATGVASSSRPEMIAGIRVRAGVGPRPK